MPLTAEQVTLYEAMVRETMEAIETAEGIERAGLVFKLLTALKQICNHPAQYLKQPGPLDGRSGKLAAFDELTDLILAGGESMLVFTQYTQMATLLRQHLDARGIGSLFLHGGVPVPRREEMVARFQAGEVPVFLLSLKAGGTGLTLTRATHVLHYDRWWNPAVEDQATDRAYRIGQDRPVQVHRLIAEGTLEDRIATLLETKRELADAVIGSGEGWIAELSTPARRAGQPAGRPVNDDVTGSAPAEFGRTWWGRAWLEALEQRARLDPDRLPRGRDYARSGTVGDLSVLPGEARAQVQGRKTQPYQVRIRVRRFTDDEWDRVLQAISAQLGHAAALLDGELPPEIADDVASTGLDLLPAGGELGPRCSCPDDADPCKHSAAACYLLTDALDADPFTLFLLRGRTRDQVLAGIRARRRGTASGQASAPQAGAAGHAGAETPSSAGWSTADEGVDARTAFAAPTPRRRSPPYAAAWAARASGGASGGSATVAVRSPRRLAGAGRGCGQPGLGNGNGPVRRRRAEPQPRRRPGSPGRPGPGYACVRCARGTFRGWRT